MISRACTNKLATVLPGNIFKENLLKNVAQCYTLGQRAQLDSRISKMGKRCLEADSSTRKITTKMENKAEAGRFPLRRTAFCWSMSP